MYFKNQLHLSNQDQKGDSGALVVTTENNVTVGLMFAIINGEAIACPISDLEKSLCVKIMTPNMD